MTATITSGNSFAAFQTLGGQLTSLKQDGVEYLWQGDPAFWKGQAPVCFPIVGSLENGEATAFGIPCRMPRHGVARTQEFTVTEQLQNSIEFTLTANKETKAHYPFDFELRIRYTLQDAVLTNEYEVLNRGASPMPFAIGGHPAFRCPLGQNERFEDYTVTFETMEPSAPLRPNHQTGLVDLSKRYPVLKDGRHLPLKHSLFYEDSLIFDNIHSKKATLRSTVTGYGIELLFPDFDNLLVWSSDNDGDFIALEPWTAVAACVGETGALEHRRGFYSLAPNELRSFRFQCRMLK